MPQAPDRFIGRLGGAEDDRLSPEGRPPQLPFEGDDLKVMSFTRGRSRLRSTKEQGRKMEERDWSIHDA